jgi:hypothetical protein
VAEGKDESFGGLAIRALGDLSKVFERLAPGAEDAFVDAIVAAKRIASIWLAI